jgi:hypothetical protein
MVSFFFDSKNGFVIINHIFVNGFTIFGGDERRVMEELHTDSIDGGHEGQLWARSRARERAYSNTNNR